MIILTPRQELFAQGIFRGLSQTEAYKQAGYKVFTHPKQGGANASRLIANDRVKARLAEMEADRLIHEAVTAQSVTRMLTATYQAATKDRQHGAAATAALGIAKLHGLLVDKVEDVTRKPARHPNAPLEVELEAWLAEHAQALTLPSGSEGLPPAMHGNGLPEPATNAPGYPGPPGGKVVPSEPQGSGAAGLPVGLPVGPEPQSPEGQSPEGQSPAAKGLGGQSPQSPESPEKRNEINGLGPGAPAPVSPGSGGPAVAEAPQKSAKIHLPD